MLSTIHSLLFPTLGHSSPFFYHSTILGPFFNYSLTILPPSFDPIPIEVVLYPVTTDDPGRTEDNPHSEAMLKARHDTFAGLWPMDATAGDPSVEQMVAAGWSARQPAPTACSLWTYGISVMTQCKSTVATLSLVRIVKASAWLRELPGSYTQESTRLLSSIVRLSLLSHTHYNSVQSTLYCSPHR